MNEKQKNSLGIAIAIAGLAGMILLSRSEQSPLSGGGGLGSQSGLSPISGNSGGGAENPVINLDFPAIPPFDFSEPTKKEGNITPPNPSNTSDEGFPGYGGGKPNPFSGTGKKEVYIPETKTLIEIDRGGFGGTWDPVEREEPTPWGFSFLNPLYDYAVSRGYGSRSGYQTTSQMKNSKKESSVVTRIPIPGSSQFLPSIPGYTSESGNSTKKQQSSTGSYFVPLPGIAAGVKIVRGEGYGITHGAGTANDIFNPATGQWHG